MALTDSSQTRTRARILVATLSLLATALVLTTVSSAAANPVRVTRGIGSASPVVLLVESQSIELYETGFRHCERLKGWRSGSGRRSPSRSESSASTTSAVGCCARFDQFGADSGCGGVRRQARAGVPVGWPRSIIVGMIIIASLSPVLPLVEEAVGLSTTSVATVDIVLDVVVLLLVLARAFFLGIALLVVLELIIPTGSLGTPWGWLRSVRDRNRRTRRYLQVLALAARHGLGGFLGRSTRTTTSST